MSKSSVKREHIVVYREKLWASAWMFLSTALVIPASLLVFAPLSMIAGLVTAIVLYTGCAVTLILMSPVIEVRDGDLIAGRARIALSQINVAEPYLGVEASAERGVNLDSRAWLLIRGWIDPVVRVPLCDPNDPTPYWLLSTRRPQKLAAAINHQSGQA
jgi:hypothetical protein